ncbi:ABC transporter substrate-binding protein [Myroides pelagicus]|uniref:ABC transporter substrate-binding protein n=1 Tax=Myroides pelagicus TaxID=270914 RepID=A0A7K1GN71_9FLAO|nr:ABC transporter substrate-binding protein [Myroides pelagicus]MEC4114557.1 ABC transporter substrate-binding protein [Myroides pelagicus]MTH30180.1 ABC transporter substrate-binding protein [Myroides pelagicus]
MRRSTLLFIHLLVVILSFTACKQKVDNTSILSEQIIDGSSSITYAKGLKIQYFEDYSVVDITQPWAGSSKSYRYVLHKKGSDIPESLEREVRIAVPVDNIIVTSTTHIPSIQLLGEEQSLVGFPGLDYISTPSVRELITEGKIVELGSNENMNFEKVVDLSPSVVVAFAMDQNNKSLQAIERTGIPVLYNGDWVEQTPLGKAEWIKLFGALYDKREQAERMFTEIEQSYEESLKLVKNVLNTPTVLSGAMYQDVWYMPQGDSWAAVYFSDAVSDYLWKETVGTGSLALSFESVFSHAEQADFWINPGAFESLNEMKKANPHYANFKAFKEKRVYSFSLTKGASGGTVFYELGPTRPDIVLKDLIAIFHPELLPNYETVFYKQLQ